MTFRCRRKRRRNAKIDSGRQLGTFAFEFCIFIFKSKQQEQLAMNKAKIYLALAFCLFVQISFAANPSCNCVAFRMDSVQDWYMSGTQRSVLNAFRDNGVPLTAGNFVANFQVAN